MNTFKPLLDVFISVSQCKANSLSTIMMFGLSQTEFIEWNLPELASKSFSNI